eukprot:1028095-Pleurochrysis_carterae.AAC.3
MQLQCAVMCQARVDPDCASCYWYHSPVDLTSGVTHHELVEVVAPHTLHQINDHGKDTDMSMLMS